MLKNITLSADGELIEQARRRAEIENTTLNAEFRRWLAHYVDRPKTVAEFAELMARLAHVQPGKTFSREELNER